MINDTLITEDLIEQVAMTFAKAISSRHYETIMPFLCDDTQLQTNNQLIIQGKTVVFNYWTQKLEKYPVLKVQVIETRVNNPKIVLLNNSGEVNTINQTLWEVMIENGKLAVLRETCN